MHNLDNNELATIRIALLDKIDNISGYIKMCEEQNQIIAKHYWQETQVKHRTLLNKLYDMQLHNQ